MRTGAPWGLFCLTIYLIYRATSLKRYLRHFLIPAFWIRNSMSILIYLRNRAHTIRFLWGERYSGKQACGVFRNSVCTFSTVYRKIFEAPLRHFRRLCIRIHKWAIRKPPKNNIIWNWSNIVNFLILSRSDSCFFRIIAIGFRAMSPSGLRWGSAIFDKMTIHSRGPARASFGEYHGWCREPAFLHSLFLGVKRKSFGEIS